MNIPLPKLKAILLYFCNYTEPRFLGKVKLMKLFYFLDFMHLKEYGSPVTFDTYINLDKGPIPSTIKNLVDDVADDLDSAELSDTIRIEKPKNFHMFRVLPTRKFTNADSKYFSETELEILKRVCEKFGNKPTSSIIDASHKEASWKQTRFLDTIPYTLAAQDPDSKADKEDIELLLKLTQ